MQWLKQGLLLDDLWEKQFTLASLHGLPLNRVYPRVFSDAELRRIHTPTLLLVGDREVIYQPRKVIRRALRVMPHIRAEIVPDAHHVTAMAQPEFVNARILQFLQ